MTNATTPMEAVFDLQRRSIEHGEQFVETGLEMQRDVTETMLRTGFETQRRAQEQAIGLARQFFEAQYDAMDAMLNDDGYRSMMLTDDAYRSMVDEPLETLEDEQFDAMTEFEDQFFATYDELGERQQELFLQAMETMLDVHEDVEQQAIEGVERTEDVTEAIQERAEAVAERAREQGQEIAIQTTEAGETQIEIGVDAAEAQLQEIDGLGPTYAERLHEQGIESMTHLAQANAETVADAAEVNQEQAEEWIEMASTW